MPTVIRTLDTVSADSVGLPDERPDVRERLLYQAPELVRAFRANSGFETAGADIGWRCRKTDAIMRPAFGAYLPTRTKSHAAFNNRAALVYGTATGQEGAMVGAGFLPLNASFSFILVGMVGPGENAYELGSGADPNGASPFWIRQTSAGGLAAKLGTGTVNAATVRPPSAGSTMIIVSYDVITGELKIMVHLESVPTVVSAGVVPTDSDMLVVGAAGTPGTTFTSEIDGGALAELLQFNVPILSSGYGNILAAGRGMVASYYGIA